MHPDRERSVAGLLVLCHQMSSLIVTLTFCSPGIGNKSTVPAFCLLWLVAQLCKSSLTFFPVELMKWRSLRQS